MSISLALVYGLAVLLPGFFFYGSIYSTLSGGDLQTDSPSPNSILTVFILGFGALIAHIFGILLVFINEFLAKTFFELNVPFDPDFYRVLQNLKASSTPDLGAALVFLVLLSLVTFLIGWGLQKAVPSLFLSLKFGHLSHIVQDSQAKHDIVVAYVVCNETVKLGRSTKEHNLGYEGMVINIGHDKTGTKYVHLARATPFILKKTSTGLSKEDYLSGDAIPYLYIPQSQIRNIALEIIHIDRSSLQT